MCAKQRESDKSGVTYCIQVMQRAPINHVSPEEVCALPSGF